jgi:hypothetical protein
MRGTLRRSVKSDALSVVGAIGTHAGALKKRCFEALGAREPTPHNNSAAPVYWPRSRRLGLRSADRELK